MVVVFVYPSRQASASKRMMASCVWAKCPLSQLRIVPLAQLIVGSPVASGLSLARIQNGQALRYTAADTFLGIFTD